MNDFLRVNDVYSEWTEKGFFHYLYTMSQSATPQIDIPFISTSGAATRLDLYYHGTHSGNKILSPLAENLIKDPEFIDAYLAGIAEIFWKLYGENLLKQYAVYSIQYDPIKNYDMEESGYDDKTGTDTQTKSGNQTRAMSGQHKTTGSTTTKTKGYNSTDYVDTDKVENTDTTSYGGDGNVGDTETTTYNNVTNQMSYNNNVNHSITRSGNIGVTTSQQMIQSEIDLWQWNFYNDVLFPAVDRVITIPLY